MRLSKHFSLHEFLISQTALRLGIDMTPDDYVLENLTELCNEYLEPIRKALGDPVIFISSGFRPLELNTAIRGSATSDHLVGRAADMIVRGIKPLKVCRVIRDLNLGYNQNIHEFGSWSHFSFANTKSARNQDLTAYRDGKKTLYVTGLHEIKDLVS